MFKADKLATNIKKSRMSMGLTQTELAEKLFISSQAISKWECGDGYPDITLLPTIANFFEVTVDELIGNDETKFVCKDCYVNSRIQYPTKGKSIKQLLPADLVFSADYDPSVTLEPESVSTASMDTGYIGELVPDGNGGW